jgi:acetyl esterase/lipase
MGYARNENIEGWMKASPVNYLTRETPPIFLYNGKTDKLVEHSQMTFFEAKAKNLGIDIKTHSITYWGHQTAFIFSNESVKLAIKFLKEKLKF